MTEITVDLEQYRTAESRVFSGRDRGKLVRAAANLDKLDSAETPVSVLIPKDIYSITSSFFLGMFGNSIRSLGEEGFKKHYLFKGAGLGALIEECVQRALRSDSPI